MSKIYRKRKLLPFASFYFISILLIAAVQSVASSCGDSSSNQSQLKANNATEQQKHNNQRLQVIIEIKEIADKSLSEVEKLIGKAESQEPVKGYPCKNADCIRAYFDGGKYEIIFKDSKVDRITINEAPDLSSSNDALQALGLPSSAPSFRNPNTVARWNSIDGLHEVSFFSDYILIQVTQPE